MKTAKVSALRWSFRKLYSARVIAPLLPETHLFWVHFQQPQQHYSKAKQQQSSAEALDESKSCHKMGKERRPRRRIFMAFLLQETSQEKKNKMIFFSAHSLYLMICTKCYFCVFAFNIRVYFLAKVIANFFLKNHIGLKNGSTYFIFSIFLLKVF